MSQNLLWLFYRSESPDSEEASKALNRAEIGYVCFNVSDRETDSREDPKPPCLIAPEGRFQGLESIQRYTKVFLKNHPPRVL